MAFSLKILLKPDSFKFQRLDIIVCFLASRAKTKKAWSSSSRDQSPLAGFSEKGTRNLRMGVVVIPCDRQSQGRHLKR